MNKNFEKSFLTQTQELRGLTPHEGMDSDTSEFKYSPYFQQVNCSMRDPGQLKLNTNDCHGTPIFTVHFDKIIRNKGTTTYC